MIKNYFKKYIFLFLLGIFTTALFGQTTFNYTGSMQTYTVPAGITSISIEAYGAQGADGHYQVEGYQPGGEGGSVYSEFYVTPGQTLYIYVGGEGERTNVSPADGGFNGGGNGYNLGNTTWYVAGGGGASDVRIGGTTLTDRIIVAGGGGGGGGSGSWGNGAGGNGGGLVGEDGHWSGLNGPGQATPDVIRHGFGGTQVAGGNEGTGNSNGSPGVLGIGGDASTGSNALASGGGGGYYGGGGGAYHGGAGGGGSSYTQLGAINIAHTQGGQTGNGQIVITVLCDFLTVTTSPSTTVCPGETVNINGVSINGGTITWDNGISNGVDYTATATTTYTSTSTDPNDCIETVTITVEDLLAPVPDLATLADVTAECEVTSLTDPTATDNCTSTVTVTNDATLPINTQGTTLVTWTYDDGNGNTSTQTQNVILTDVTAPVEDLATLVDVTDECEVTSLIDPTATDNCTGTVTVTNDATLPINTQGTTLVTWTYDDGNGNTSTQTQNVILTDVTAPVADLATLLDVTDECEVTSLIDPTATDNCAGTVTVTNDATLPINTQGTTLVTWTYDDGNGNTSTQTQNVILTDVTAPVEDLATLVDVTDECEVTSLIDPTATDNCTGTVTVTNDATLPINTQGTTLVTWTYDDGNGNTSTQTQNVILTDVTAPVEDLATLVDVTDECEVTSLTDPTATDNCAGTVTVTNDATLPINTQGTTLVTWTYDDGNGNTSTQTQNVVITDVTAPTIVCPNDTVVCDQIVNYSAPVGLDNCSGQSTLLTLGMGSGSTLPIGVTTEEYTVTDIGGNTASCSFTITVSQPSYVFEMATICSGDSIMLEGAYQYASGVYYDTLSTAMSCDSVVATTLTVNSLMVDLGADTTICAEDTAMIDAGVFDTYLWSTGETTQTIIVDSSGLGIGTHVFFVTAMDTLGCEAMDTITVTIEICSGIADDIENSFIQVYPNPSTGIYTISADRDYNYIITDIAGRQISSGKLENTESQIDISDQAQGIYLIKFVNNGISKTIKLIKK